jgi:hypothetical protein
MTTTDTATAAHQAHVTPATIRTWCRNGIVTAVKAGRRWAIDTASLLRRIAIGRRTVARQLAAFVNPDAAQTKAIELIETGAIVPAGRRGLYLAVSTKADDRYLVDTREGSCTCLGHANTGHCYHQVAAVMVETGTAALIDA